MDKKMRLALAAAFLLAIFLAPGCASWDRPTETKGTEADGGFASQFRLGSPDGKKTGFDPRARDIEGSLGLE
jgi:hypothetical protein